MLLKSFFRPPVLWSSEEIEDALYILARDWGRGFIAHDLKKFPDVALFLAEKSLEGSDWDARWQLAEVLGRLARDARIEPLLLRFADDDEEYVRRRALQSLARIDSPQVEGLALREWTREDENQEWARMNALACWQRIGSALLESHLREAEEAAFLYLPDFARRLRNGEVDLD